VRFLGCRLATTFVGVDLGKKQDPSAVAVVSRAEDQVRLVGLKVFPLETEYVAIVGFLKLISERVKHVHRFLIDQTGVGEPFVEEAKHSIQGIEGLVLTMAAKQEVLGYLKIVMQNKRLLIPYELELTSELNIERFELTKAGQVQFSHPSGTHDDRLWALALAVYATRGGAVGSIVTVKRRE
jgi:phage FluMu gp28-like protein